VAILGGQGWPSVVTLAIGRYGDAHRRIVRVEHSKGLVSVEITRVDGAFVADRMHARGERRARVVGQVIRGHAKTCLLVGKMLLGATEKFEYLRDYVEIFVCEKKIGCVWQIFGATTTSSTNVQHGHAHAHTHTHTHTHAHTHTHTHTQHTHTTHTHTHTHTHTPMTSSPVITEIVIEASQCGSKLVGEEPWRGKRGDVSEWCVRVCESCVCV
jgi:hypothetical protein